MTEIIDEETFEDLCRKGYTRAEMARAFYTDESTVRHYCRRHYGDMRLPEIRKMIAGEAQ